VASPLTCKVHAVTANFALLNHFADHSLLFEDLSRNSLPIHPQTVGYLVAVTQRRGVFQRQQTLRSVCLANRCTKAAFGNLLSIDDVIKWIDPLLPRSTARPYGGVCSKYQSRRNTGCRQAAGLRPR
jgi:hypothetical protein